MGRMDEAVALFHELDARAGLMRASSIMGDVARFHDDYARAHSAYHACEAVARSMGLPVGLSLANRGALALQEANLDEAARLLHEGWTGCVAEGKRGVLGFVIAMVGSLLAALGEPAAAATVLGCARAEFDRLGSDLQGPDLRVYERGLAAARDALSQPDFDAAWEHGRGLAPEGGYEFAVRYLTGEAVE